MQDFHKEHPAEKNSIQRPESSGREEAGLQSPRRVLLVLVLVILISHFFTDRLLDWRGFNPLPVVEACLVTLMAFPLLYAFAFRPLVREIEARRKVQNQLMESETILRSFLDTPGVMRGIIELVPEDILHVSENSHFAALWGTTPELAEGKLATELGLNKDAVLLWTERCEESQRMGRPVTFEYLHATGGAERWFSVTVAAMGAASHGRPHFACAMLDVTAQKQVVEALRGSEHRLRAAMESSLDAFYLFRTLRDQAGRIADFEFVELNSPAEKLISRQRSQVLGQRVCELLPIHRTGGFFEKYVRVVETGESLEEEFPISAPGCPAEWLHHQVVKVGDGIAITSRDITHRKKMEQRITDALHFNQAIITSSPVGVVVWKASGDCVLANQAATRLIGGSLDQILAQNFRQLSSWRESNLLQTAQLALSSGDQSRCEAQVNTTFGREMWVDCWFLPFTWAGESHLLMLLDDISERRRPEAALTRLNRLYALLSWCNQTIVRERSRDALFRQICRIGVEVGQFRLAWIALADVGTNQFEVAAMHAADGLESMAHLDEMITKAANSPPVASSLRAGDRAVSNDLRADEQFTGWLDLANQCGCRSLAVVPLQLKGRTIGAMGIHSSDISFFAEPEIKLLDQMALDVSFALEVLDKEKQRQQAEAALRESETQFQSAFDCASIGMALVAPNGRWLKVNRALCELTGYSRQELQAKTFQDITHPADLEMDLGYVQQMLSGQISTYQMEKRYFHKAGHVVWVLLSVSLVRNPEGEPLYFISQIQDITGRKQAEEKVRQQAMLLDVAQDAITVRDLQTRVLYWNKGAEQLYGWQAEEVLGKRSGDLLYAPRFLPDMEKALAAVQKEGVWQGELHQITKGKTPIVVQARLTLVRDPDGQPTSILTVSADVTEKKLLERQLLQAQRMESIGTLAAGIAHDLNNILAPIRMSAQMLLLEKRTDEEANMLATIEASVKRGADIVKQVLTFARGMEGERISIQPKYLIKEMAKIIGESFPKNIKAATSVPSNLWVLTGDATQLHQVLMNLCVNARDAMPEGGPLELAAENVRIASRRVGLFGEAKPGPYVKISVQDGGHGIPAEIIEKIFDPFFTTKEHGKGTGLGLSTVLGIVRSHQGFLEVESTPGRGSTFKIYLPARPGETIQASRGVLQPWHSGGGQWILVVDDESSIRDLTRQTLVKHDYNVLLAANGREALDLLACHRDQISVVVTDILMPVMDGLALIRTIRQASPALPVIACTGWGQDDLRDQLKQLGIKSLLEKPYPAEDLLKILHQYFTAG